MLYTSDIEVCIRVTLKGVCELRAHRAHLISYTQRIIFRYYSACYYALSARFRWYMQERCNTTSPLYHILLFPRRNTHIALFKHPRMKEAGLLAGKGHDDETPIYRLHHTLTKRFVRDKVAHLKVLPCSPSPHPLYREGVVTLLVSGMGEGRGLSFLSIAVSQPPIIVPLCVSMPV